MTTENHQVPDGYPHVPSAADIEAVTQTLTGAYPNLSVAQLPRDNQGESPRQSG